MRTKAQILIHPVNSNLRVRKKENRQTIFVEDPSGFKSVPAVATSWCGIVLSNRRWTRVAETSWLTTPQALGNLAQGNTLGDWMELRSFTLKALDKYAASIVSNPFRVRNFQNWTCLPGCYPGLSYLTPAA